MNRLFLAVCFSEAQHRQWLPIALLAIILAGVSCLFGAKTGSAFTTQSVRLHGPQNIEIEGKRWPVQSVEMVRLQNQKEVLDRIQILVSWDSKPEFQSPAEAAEAVWPLIRYYFTAGIYNKLTHDFPAEPPLQADGIWVLMTYRKNFLQTDNYRAGMSLREIVSRIETERRTISRK